MTLLEKHRSSHESLALSAWQTPAPSSSASTGTNLDGETADQAIGNFVQSDGSSLLDLGPLTPFGSWEAVLCAILHKAEELSGFQPGSTKFDPQAWAYYLTKVSTIPFVSAMSADTRTTSINPTSSRAGVDATLDLIRSTISAVGPNSAIKPLQQMAQRALRTSGSDRKVSFLHMGLVTRNQSALYFGIVRTEVELQNSSGYQPVSQTLIVQSTIGTIDMGKCWRYARGLLGWDRQDPNTWVNNANSASMPSTDCAAWND